MKSFGHYTGEIGKSNGRSERLAEGHSDLSSKSYS